MRNDSELCCVYCLQLLDADDDAQRVDKHNAAHTACAFAADAALDAEKLCDESTDDDN